MTAAAQKTGRIHIAKNALELAQTRLDEDQWPEYYDGTRGMLIGKAARRYQTWTITGFLLAKELMRHPNYLELCSFTEFDGENASQACNL